jgi:hypothetical protein
MNRLLRFVTVLEAIALGIFFPLPSSTAQQKPKT